MANNLRLMVAHFSWYMKIDNKRKAHNHRHEAQSENRMAAREKDENSVPIVYCTRLQKRLDHPSCRELDHVHCIGSSFALARIYSTFTPS
jgi:hypothetical protein